MSQGVQVVGVYVRGQDEALAFYVDSSGSASTRTRATATFGG